MTTGRKYTPSAAGEIMTAREVEILTVDEVAAWLRIHPTTVYRLLRQGKIPGFKVGSDWRLNREMIEQWSKREVEEEV
jgi:excisionase family DNA binding protein